jgi:ribosome silencing factor RsfS/YbeB/iojap
MEQKQQTDTARAEQIVRAMENPRRYGHTMRVLEMAVELAGLYGVDEDKARTAALFHDICKDCVKPGNDIAHAGEAAELIRSAHGVDDEDVLNAVRYHTTGRARMSKLELIVFLADTLEPSRTYAGVERLRRLAYEDLYAAALETLKELNMYLAGRGIAPARDSIEAIEWLEGETKNMLLNKAGADAGDTTGNVNDAVDGIVNGDISGKVIAGNTGDAAPRPGADAEKSVELALALAKAIDDKKGRDIVILDISEHSSFADCFVNATASNARMLVSIKDEVDRAMTERGLEIRRSEGRPDSGWILIDCGDVIVNIFLEEQRGKYQIEKIWSDAARVDLPADTDR